MPNQKSIAFVASECQPFITSGGLAEVIGSLPKKMVASNKNLCVNVFLPFYATVKKNMLKNSNYLAKKL